MLIEQNVNYALGNFIMLTPGIKRLSEKINDKIDVYFTIPYVKECFMDCEFINHVDFLYEKPSFSSKMVNREIPDYKYMFNKMTGEDWNEKYHTRTKNDKICD